MIYRKLIAILRGIQPHEAADIAKSLVKCGFDQIEVPLNSPNPFDSIGSIIEAVGETAQVGAGTVLTVDDVQTLKGLGANMVISPNCNVDVIRATKTAGMQSFPGVMTPTECFAALDAGADGLKFFPAALVGPHGLAAVKAVLPPVTQLYAVGGAGPENFGEWIKSGADGFGIGSALYRPGDTVSDVERKAKAIVAAYDSVISAPQ